MKRAKADLAGESNPPSARELAGVMTAIALAVFQMSTGISSAPQPPFKSGVELVWVDVLVVDAAGAPIAGLGPADFDVRIDRRSRRVVSADFVRLGSPSAGDAPSPESRPGSGSAVNGGRTLVLAIDESSFHSRHAPAVVHAARRFIQQLEAGDRVALFKYPVYPESFVLTDDHTALLRELDGVVGVLDVPRGRYQLGLAEVADITAGDFDALTQAARRECPARPQDCYRPIREQAYGMGIAFENQVAQSVAGLRMLFRTLAGFPDRKTVVVISGGLFGSTRPGSRPDVNGIITTMGEEAARSNANLYVVYVDSAFLDAFAAAGAGTTASFLRNPGAAAEGIERFAGVGGGALIRVPSGDVDRAFTRVLRETSAYYLLGVDPDSRDRDGRSHFISVAIKGRRAEVRARRTVVIPAGSR